MPFTRVRHGWSRSTLKCAKDVRRPSEAVSIELASGAPGKRRATHKKREIKGQTATSFLKLVTAAIAFSMLK
jgi:hypothetical protein